MTGGQLTQPRDLEALTAELVRFCRWTYDRGLVAAAGGNLSVRVPGASELLITRTGANLGAVTPQDIVRVAFDGTLVEASLAGARPSKELPFHAASYELRPDVNAVIHLHPPYTVAQSVRLRPLPIVTVSARAGLRHVPCVPVAGQGTPLLHGYVREAISAHPGSDVIMLAAHGLTAVGADLTAAFNAADLCEITAKQACIMELLGIDFQLP